MDEIKEKFKYELDMDGELYGDEMICPYCFECMTEPYIHTDEDADVDCESCGESFHYNRSTIVHYTTKK